MIQKIYDVGEMVDELDDIFDGVLADVCWYGVMHIIGDMNTI